MRTKTFLLIAVTALGVSGIAVAVRLNQSAGSIHPLTPCTLEARGVGFLLTYRSGEIPIRNCSWAVSESPTLRYLHVITQNDHHFLYQVHESGTVQSSPILMPGDLPPSFIRTAVLKRTLPLPDGSLLLHLVSETQKERPSLLIRTASQSGAVLWYQRFPGTSSTISTGSGDKEWVLFGGSTALTHISGWNRGAALSAPAVRSIDPPAQAGEALDARALPDGSVIFSHTKGLSAWIPDRGWQEVLPTPVPVSTTPRTLGALAYLGGRILWQPLPGTLYAVSRTAEAFSCIALDLPMTPQNLALDRSMLRLLGNDPEGALWFDLQAPPQIPQAPTAAPADGQEPTGWKDEQRQPAPDDEAWKAHLARPLDRIYWWAEGTSELKQLSWAEAQQALGQPLESRSTGLNLQPSQGIASSQEANPSWWVSLARLKRVQSAPQPK